MSGRLRSRADAARSRSRALSAAISYAGWAAAWIVASDLVADAFDLSSPAFNIAKGFLFVIATTLLLWRAFCKHEGQLASMIADLQRAREQLTAALEGVTRTVGAMIEARDPYTAGHQHRVGDLARLIGRHLGLDENCLEGLRIGGYLHDVGKVGVDESILNFPGLLSSEQRAQVQMHSGLGCEILSAVPFAWPIAQIANEHHERLDGSGYPQGLRGDEILLEARIVAVADVFDALISERPYRTAGSVEMALTTLLDGAGTHFDRDVVGALVGLVNAGEYEPCQRSNQRSPL